jgi:hypothetical protein
MERYISRVLLFPPFFYCKNLSTKDLYTTFSVLPRVENNPILREFVCSYNNIHGCYAGYARGGTGRGGSEVSKSR